MSPSGVPRPAATVADVIGATVAAQGPSDAFGVLGSGNLVATNAMIAAGVRFHHARHEAGAVAMADGHARVSGRTGVCSVHQGPGLTNTMTALAEAAKSRTPLLVIAGETPAAALTSNFRIDQHGLVESVGAIAERVHSADSAAADAQRALHRAQTERRPVVLMMPIDIQAQAATSTEPRAPAPPLLAPAEPDPTSIRRVVDALVAAHRPVIIAGRGAVLAGAGPALETLGALTGALLATSAPVNGLFAGRAYALGISGGFACPLAAELLPQADLVLAAGASLNHWTTGHGALIADTATLVQIDADPRAIGRNRPADLAILADADRAAAALNAALTARGHSATGWRSAARREEIAGRTWQTEPYTDTSTPDRIDPRTLSKAVNALLPAEKTVAVDSGAFLGWPAMFLSVPDASSWVFANGFQAVGLGLGAAIGAAVARPDRLTVAALGDGGTFMALAELETAARLELKLLVLIYDDAAYGAEVHHFGPMGHDVSGVQFPDANLAAIAAAAGTAAATVRTEQDLSPITDWLAEPTPRPLVLDAKVDPGVCADWLAEAFRGG